MILALQAENEEKDRRIAAVEVERDKARAEAEAAKVGLMLKVFEIEKLTASSHGCAINVLDKVPRSLIVRSSNLNCCWRM